MKRYDNYLYMVDSSYPPSEDEIARRKTKVQQDIENASSLKLSDIEPKIDMMEDYCTIEWVECYDNYGLNRCKYQISRKDYTMSQISEQPILSGNLHSCINIMARDFKFDGIMYSVVDENFKTCRTAERNKVAGIVILPELVYDANIPYTLVVIGHFSFIDCDKLNDIIIPSSVKIIGRSAFHRCDGLTHFEISNSVVSIGEYAFCDCDSLPHIVIPDSVKTMGNCGFEGCRNLEDVYLSNSLMTICVGTFFVVFL